MPIPLAVVEAGDLRALAVNESMDRVFHRADAAGLSISAMLPPAHPLSDPRPYRSVARDGKPVVSTIVIDGQTWEWFIRPLKGDGPSVEYLLTGLLAQPAAAREGDVAGLREMNAGKTEFLNLAAHQLRTPLSVILGYSSLLAQGGLSPEHQKLAGSRVFEKARIRGRPADAGSAVQAVCPHRDRGEPTPHRHGDRPLPRAGGRPSPPRPGPGGQPPRSR